MYENDAHYLLFNSFLKGQIDTRVYFEELVNMGLDKNLAYKIVSQDLEYKREYNAQRKGYDNDMRRESV